MTAIAAITLADAASSNVEFKPSAIDSNGVARYYEAGDVMDARRQLSLGVRLPSKGSQVARVTAKVVTPVMDSVDASLKVGDCICNIEFVLPKRATAAQRDDLLAFATEYLAEASLIAAVSDLESVF